MRLFVLLLSAACVAHAQIDPRGARPVVPNTRSEKCAPEKEWPFCTDDQWGPKCPSGCRINGLLEKFDHEFLKRIERIRGLLGQSQDKQSKANQVSKETYNYLREKLTVDSGLDNNYFDMAQTLRQRITDMKIKIDQQLHVLGALKERVRDQVNDMQRLEVDIDMKLRTCKGSCKTYHNYEVDHEEQVALEKQMNQLDSLSGQSVETWGSLQVMKSRPLSDAVVDSVFKSKNLQTDPQTAQQQTTEDLFPEVKTVQLFLEVEGSSSSPATISKVPGTSLSTDSSTDSSPSAGPTIDPSHMSITELGGSDPFGPGFEFSSGASTKTVSCTKSMRTVVVDTGDGPVQRMEEVIEGGPECQNLESTKGAITFPSLTGGGTKTLQFTSGSAKGSLEDSKTSFGVDPFAGNPGIDLGAFLTDNAEDDVPDFHARSVKSARVERQADYVGKDCVAAQRFHLNGESNGVFQIRPSPSGAALSVFCQQEGLMGGWLLVQQRESGGLSFNRSWAEYRAGFGAVDARGHGEFWIGNQNLHLLTNQGETMLRAELEDWEGGVVRAEYTVKVGTEAEGFALQVGGYTGDAGDGLERHSGAKFSTYDRDNDSNEEENCAASNGGGFWFKQCENNLNGVYRKQGGEEGSGVVWATYRPPNYSLKRATVFIRPAEF